MNIGVIGIGGVGGYFGGKLTQLLKDDKELKIFFIARNQHLNEIKKNGLILDTEEGIITCIPTLATDDISELPQLDLCLICVKSYDLENILIQLKSKIADHTMILPLLNGVDIYERIRLIIKNGIIFPSCVYVGTHIEKPGKVVQRGGACIIHFGTDPKTDFVDPELFKMLEKSNIKYNWTKNPYTEIWSKFIFIASFGLVTANYNKTIGEVIESEELSTYVKNIMSEIHQIAMKKHVTLPPSIIDDAYAKGKTFPFETKTSFQRDYENKDKLDERDLFGGTIIRLGDQQGIKTETTKIIYNSIIEKEVIMLPKTHLIYFSPTGTTRKIIKVVASGLNAQDIEHHDLTRIEKEFSLCLDNGLALIGVPVYAGRVPEIFLKRIMNLSGKGIPAILLVLYGNRAYEDALVELRDVITAKGFNVIAAGAFIGEHSYSTDKHSIAANRPDAEDIQKAREFGAAITYKLQGECNQTTLDIPGNTPYKERVPIGGICPETNPELCTLCKTCASVCPAFIITVDQDVSTEAGNCVRCCSCVKLCPHHARVMRHPMVEARREMMVKNCSERKEPSCYL